MGKKLYVGNLPFSANESSLEQIFAQSGTVESAKVILIATRVAARALASSKCRQRLKPGRYHQVQWR